MKENVLKEVKQELKFMEREPAYIQSRKQLLEQYNRRDNVEVFAVPFELNTEGVLMKENGKDTIGKVMTYPAA